MDLINVYGVVVRVRLAAIDAPEPGQFGYRGARRRLRELLGVGPLQVTLLRGDAYAREVAEIVNGAGVNVSTQLLIEGWAWWYKRYARGELRRAQYEREARQAGRGLWAGPGPVAPWMWRKGIRGPGTVYQG